ncbi:uncharacterized protein LOC115747388 [Rhodamnia argentea]|uniref:Uncharacterized protein LOC115747388 n=1 Tax=Rhodamnia argentea TaxID=178133 RepID=A0A8B8PX76_9MYRT|nr:uncharacterized protein LOC115747388 [Rhodamnia argentea]
MTLSLFSPPHIPFSSSPTKLSSSFPFRPHAAPPATHLPNSSGSDPPPKVIIVGAGLAGLAAAARLRSHDVPFLLLEASDAVGGRVRTDLVDGFLLDRGFQIFITAYPEAQKLLDYRALDLKRFYSGALVYYDGRFHTVADPIRHFSDSVNTLVNPIGSVLDKLLIGLARIRVLSRSDREILTADEVRTIDLLTKLGFSDSIVERFFRPFFGGIFFDRELETTSRLFDFVFKCLALGDNALPAKGIAAIPKQLALKLPQESILLNTKAVSIEFDKSESPILRLESGEILRSELGVIVAVEEPAAAKLLAGKYEGAKANRKPPRSTVCLYFAADRDRIPVKDPVLFLNGSGKGIVNNMFFATNVAPSYGPPEKALVSVSLIGLFEGVSDNDLTAKVVRELTDWFGESAVGSWRHLRTYRIGFAQPNQCPPTDLTKDPRVGSGVYVCGDYLTSATFDGALVSGRLAAEALLKDRALIRI